MRFDKLTLKSQEALSEAQSAATERGHSQITLAHLLRALPVDFENDAVAIGQVLLDLLATGAVEIVEHSRGLKHLALLAE